MNLKFGCEKVEGMNAAKPPLSRKNEEDFQENFELPINRQKHEISSVS